MTRLSARFAALLTALLSASAVTLTAAPAQAVLAVPVNCAVGEETVLRWDNLAYDLSGTCGVVRVTASNAVVTMPTARRLVVEGAGNVIDSKPVDVLVLRGSDQHVSLPAARVLRSSSRRSTVDVEGLAEKVRLRGTGTTVSADRVHDLRISGDRHRVHVRRGYDARITGDDNRARFRRLGELVVAGRDNVVRVRKGRTEVREEGRGNRVRVNRRG